MRSFILAVLVACGSPHPPAAAHPDDPAAAPRDAAPAPMPSDAAVAIDAAVAASPAAAFVAPDPLPPPGPATPASAHCRTTTDEDLTREEQREAAAIDVALRAQGFTPLHVHDQREDPDQAVPRQGVAQVGHPIRQADGSYVLVVGTIRGCRGEPPLVAMTKTHEVFVYEPVFKPAYTRTVTECNGSCRGACGINMPERAAVARVPGDAVFGAPREIPVPIAIKVAFKISKPMRCNVP